MKFYPRLLSKLIVIGTLASFLGGPTAEGALSCSGVLNKSNLFGTAASDIFPGWQLGSIDLAKLNESQKKQILSIGASWDPIKINERRLPLPIAMIHDQAGFSTHKKFPKQLPRSNVVEGQVTPAGEVHGLNVRDMLVRASGGELLIPPEAAQFREVIELAIAFDRRVNPNSSAYNIYISTSQGLVPANQGQRRLGAHTDGFQEHEVTYNRDRIIDHTYIVSDAIPTEFFDQAFAVGNRSGNEALNFFDSTADDSAIVRLQPYVIALMDAFTVHRVALARQATQRTFIKITFSLERFNREGNTLNPLQDYTDWRWAPRMATRNSTSADVFEGQ